MLTLNTLKPQKGSRKNRFRVGRGQGSGAGSTAGYGNNGARARSGNKYKAYFEGGQTPLIRRTPKRGFVNSNKVVYQVVNVGALEKLDIVDKEIDAIVLYEYGLINSPNLPIKILGNGTLTKNLVVKADAYSATAREKLKMPKLKTR